MGAWFLICVTLFIIFGGKCVKELLDVKALARMSQQERNEVLIRRNFYDNHA